MWEYYKTNMGNKIIFQTSTLKKLLIKNVSKIDRTIPKENG